MYYETMPLYPRMGPDCDGEPCMRVPVFGGDGCGPGRMPDGCQLRRVTIENPCRPGERAEVLLGVDECGNLVVCVRRDPRWEGDCRCRRPHRPDCRPGCRPDPRPECRPLPPCPSPPIQPRNPCRGRLYGSWK